MSYLNYLSKLDYGNYYEYIVVLNGKELPRDKRIKASGYDAAYRQAQAKYPNQTVDVVYSAF